MKQIKISGRERAVLRAIDYTAGSTGQEIMDRTQIALEDVADVLSGLMETGYVESFPVMVQVPLEKVAETRFEVNPSFAQQIKAAMLR